MNAIAEVAVLNVPEYAYNHRFWLVTPHNGDLWFWGAWDEFEKCIDSKNGDDQIVVQNIGKRGNL